MYAYYHAGTSDKLKKKIIDTFREKSGCLRLLFATNAFGIGSLILTRFQLINENVGNTRSLGKWCPVGFKSKAKPFYVNKSMIICKI